MTGVQTCALPIKNPSTVYQVAEIIQKYVPGAEISNVPMRTGEPHGGAISKPEDLTEIVDAVFGVNNKLRRKDIRRVVRELGTVVSADISTLEAIGMSVDAFKPIEEAIKETVEWFKENEGVTWHKTKL